MISIIPKPNSIVQLEGYFELFQPNITSEFDNYDEIITAILAEFNIEVNKNNKPSIGILRVDNLALDEYELHIGENGVKICATSESGAFYGLQTLKQIINQNYVGQSAVTIPYCKIVDKPRFYHRSFMLDESRHFFGKDTVKEFLDMMALLKLNRLHWHLSDDQGWRVEIKKYPLLTEKGSVRANTQYSSGHGNKKWNFTNEEYGRGCYYTQEDIKEIVAYAKERHIEVYPEIDMPGHLVAAINCYPELSCFDEKVEVSTTWGIKNTIGCAGKDVLYQFVKDVISELNELFPSGYFHIGGDEVPKIKWKKCPNCQQKIKELGLKDENDLQAYFNNEIVEYLAKYNKKTVAWNEILKGNNVSNNTIVQYWIGNANKNGVVEWLEKGNNVIISLHNYLYANYPYAMTPLAKSYNIDLDTFGIDKKYEKQVLGFEVPLWTEHIRDKSKAEFYTYPRMMCLAEVNWTNAENKNFSDFERHLGNINAYLDRKQILHAPKEIYAPKGLAGLGKRILSGRDWYFTPNKEYSRFVKGKNAK